MKCQFRSLPQCIPALAATKPTVRRTSSRQSRIIIFEHHVREQRGLAGNIVGQARLQSVVTAELANQPELQQNLGPRRALGENIPGPAFDVKREPSLPVVPGASS